MSASQTNNLEAAAIRCGCEAADIHLICSFPDCSCKLIPKAVKAALAFSARVKEIANVE